MQPEHKDVHTPIGGIADRPSLIAEFRAGQSLGGRYQVISRIGRGGMGVVYRVKQIFLNKEFALKTIDKSCLSDMAIRRFQQEARTAFNLDHPSIIAVHDFGLLDDETPFLVMELATGETLAERLKRGGCLTVSEAVPVFVQVCFGLAYAHSKGIVHRDIKPSNIMLLDGMPMGAEGSVKIVDFGIAKFTQGEAGDVQALTKTGEIFGSPLYMSPEQCAGERVDNRADIYSLGCVLFEALTGTPPLVGENALSTMMRHQTEPAPTLREASLGADFPQAMEAVVATMLAKSPSKRYQNMGIVAQDLGAVDRGESISRIAKATKAAPLPQEKTISLKRRDFYGLLLGLSILSASIAGIGVYLFPRERIPAALPPAVIEPPQMEAGFGLKTGGSYEEFDHIIGHQLTASDLKEKLSKPQPGNSLRLRNNMLDAEMLATIAKTPKLNSVDFINDHINDIESLSKLSRLGLKYVTFSNTNFNDDGAKIISTWPNLKSVQVDWTLITDQGVRSLSKLRELDRLQLGGSKTTNEGLRSLANCRKLRILGLRNISTITNEGLSALEGMDIVALDLQMTPINDSGLVHLTRMPHLYQVNLAYDDVTAAGLGELCSKPSIHKIQWAHCPKIKRSDIQLLQVSYPRVEFEDTADKGMGQNDLMMNLVHSTDSSVDGAVAAKHAEPEDRKH